MARTYVAFFHGRKTTDENLEDWGFEGPVVGPVGVSFSYGTLRLCSCDTETFVQIPMAEDLFKLAPDEYYGDCDIQSLDDHDEAQFLKAFSSRIMPVEELNEKLNKHFPTKVTTIKG